MNPPPYSPEKFLRSYQHFHPDKQSLYLVVAGRKFICITFFGGNKISNLKEISRYLPSKGVISVPLLLFLKISRILSSQSMSNIQISFAWLCKESNQRFTAKFWVDLEICVLETNNDRINKK